MSDDPVSVSDLTDHVEQIARYNYENAQPEPAGAVVSAESVHEAENRVRASRAVMFSERVPARFVDATLDDLADQPDRERELILDWADDPAGRNLILVGPVGVGKTHAAIAACRPLWVDGVDVEFWPVGKLLDELRPGGPEGELDRLTKVPVLIIDDVGSERATDWTAERMYGLVNQRWLTTLPIVATSNLAREDLIEKLGERVYSRLTGDGAVGVRLTGDDRRRKR